MTVTVLSGPERRRRWTSAEKLRIVEESLVAESSVIEIARRHDVHPNQLHAWRRQARLGLLGYSVAAVGQTEGRFVGQVGLPQVIEVVLRNGRLLRLPEGVTPARAVVLADALERQ